MEQICQFWRASGLRNIYLEWLKKFLYFRGSGGPICFLPHVILHVKSFFTTMFVFTSSDCMLKPASRTGNSNSAFEKQVDCLSTFGRTKVYRKVSTVQKIDKFVISIHSKVR